MSGRRRGWGTGGGEARRGRKLKDVETEDWTHWGHKPGGCLCKVAATAAAGGAFRQGSKVASSSFLHSRTSVDHRCSSSSIKKKLFSPHTVTQPFMAFVPHKRNEIVLSLLTQSNVAVGCMLSLVLTRPVHFATLIGQLLQTACSIPFVVIAPVIQTCACY